MPDEEDSVERKLSMSLDALIGEEQKDVSKIGSGFRIKNTNKPITVLHQKKKAVGQNQKNVILKAAAPKKKSGNVKLSPKKIVKLKPGQDAITEAAAAGARVMAKLKGVHISTGTNSNKIIPQGKSLGKGKVKLTAAGKSGKAILKPASKNVLTPAIDVNKGLDALIEEEKRKPPQQQQNNQWNKQKVKTKEKGGKGYGKGNNNQNEHDYGYRQQQQQPYQHQHQHQHYQQHHQQHRQQHHQQHHQHHQQQYHQQHHHHHHQHGLAHHAHVHAHGHAPTPTHYPPHEHHQQHYQHHHQHGYQYPHTSPGHPPPYGAPPHQYPGAAPVHVPNGAPPGYPAAGYPPYSPTAHVPYGHGQQPPHAHVPQYQPPYDSSYSNSHSVHGTETSAASNKDRGVHNPYQAEVPKAMNKSKSAMNKRSSKNIGGTKLNQEPSSASEVAIDVDNQNFKPRAGDPFGLRPPTDDMSPQKKAPATRPAVSFSPPPEKFHHYEHDYERAQNQFHEKGGGGIRQVSPRKPHDSWITGARPKPLRGRRPQEAYEPDDRSDSAGRSRSRSKRLQQKIKKHRRRSKRSPSPHVTSEYSESASELPVRRRGRQREMQPAPPHFFADVAAHESKLKQKSKEIMLQRQNELVSTTSKPSKQYYILHVGNVPKSLTAVDLHEAFSKETSAGAVVTVDTYKESQNSVRAEVRVLRKADAQNLVRRFHGGDLNGQYISMRIESPV